MIARPRTELRHPGCPHPGMPIRTPEAESAAIISRSGAQQLKSCSQLPAHNRLVAGSSPAGPTTQSCVNRKQRRRRPDGRRRAADAFAGDPSESLGRIGQIQDFWASQIGDNQERIDLLAAHLSGAAPRVIANRRFAGV